MTLTERTHISIFLPSLRGGGAERVMVTLANALAESGHVVDLVLAQAQGEYRDEVAETVNVVDLNAKRMIMSLPALRRYMRRARPDAMLSVMNQSNVVAILARMVARVPLRLVISERNTIAYLANDGLKQRILLKLMRWSYHKADHLVAVTQGVASEVAELIGLPKTRISVIHNPVDIEAIQQHAQVVPSHPWVQQRTAPVILSVGRLAPQKDHATLLRAFALVRAHQKARLVILGEGPLRPALEALARELRISEDVDMIGFVQNPFGWMAQCDVLALSSVHEGLPNVLIQGLACGAPIVSTRCSTGPEEILEGERWGRLVPTENPQALAEAIMETCAKGAPQGAKQRADAFCPGIATAKFGAILKDH